MSLFSFKDNAERIGVVIDIGSGSVLAAIVSSKETENEPTIIWSQREHAPLRNIESIDQSAKAVLTALINVLMRVDSEGRIALRDYQKGAKINEIQCCISAPWSYTVTKTIAYAQEDPFEITENLVEELVRTALQKITLELDQSKSANELGLTVITRSTMDLLANGYRIRDPFGEKAKSLSLTHASVITQRYLMEEIERLKEKLFNDTPIHYLSYILALYSVTRDMFPDQYDTCLIDVTYEATEIGVVRDGALMYSTHTPFGSFSLAREISNITSVPLYEAFQYLHSEKPYAFIDDLSVTQKEEVEKIFESYVQKLTELFHETGDDLSIPKQILLHADLKSEPLFSDLIDKAARRAIKSDPIIKMVTPAILKKMPSIKNKLGSQGHEEDTAMLVSAQFFHKQVNNKMFEYL